MSTPYGPLDPTPSSEESEKQYFRPTVPGQSVPGQNQMIMKPTSTLHAVIRGSLAAFLAVAAVVNQFWGFRFPSNAPVEQIFVFGITIDLIAATIVLGIFAVLASARRSVPVKPESISPQSVAAVILSGIAALAWILFCLIPVLSSVASGERYQYMTAVGAIFFLGVPWVLGMVFGALSLRSGGRLTPILGTIAIALGVVLAVAAVTFSVIYGLGLSN